MSRGAGVRLITMKEIINRIPYSKVHIYRLMSMGEFPASVRVGAQRVAWVEQEIDEWIEERIYARDNLPESHEAIARRKLARRAIRSRYKY